MSTSTGTVLWKNRVNGGYNVVYNQSLLASHGMVFATGDVQARPSNYNAFVRAFDTGTGELQWSDDLVDPSLDSTADSVVAGGDNLMVRTVECDDGFTAESSCQWILTSYAPRTGSLRWERRILSDTGLSSLGGHTLAIQGHQAYVGGTFLDETLAGTWTLHAFDVDTGDPLWEDAGGGGGVHAILARGDRLLAVGYIEPGAIDAYDYCVRAYRISGNRSSPR